MKKNWLYTCLCVLFCIGLFTSCVDISDNPVPVPPTQTEETTEPTSGDDENATDEPTSGDDENATDEPTSGDDEDAADEPTSGDDEEDPNAKGLYDDTVKGDEIL